MTANAEARALLDQLMGVERDALLPAGKQIDFCSCLGIINESFCDTIDSRNEDLIDLNLHIVEMFRIGNFPIHFDPIF